MYQNNMNTCKQLMKGCHFVKNLSKNVSEYVTLILIEKLHCDIYDICISAAFKI